MGSKRHSTWSNSFLSFLKLSKPALLYRNVDTGESEATREAAMTRGRPRTMGLLSFGGALYGIAVACGLG